MSLNIVVLILTSITAVVNSECSLSVNNVQFESKSCSAQHTETALSETCSCVPRPVVVRLPWPNNTDVHHMTPTHVQVYRCGGGCQTSQSPKTCSPVSSRPRSVPVMLGKCGLGPGRCDKECASISVEEHTQCECVCDQGSREQCRVSRDHVWRPETCQCQCRDFQAQKQCQDGGEEWSQSTCTCLHSTPRSLINTLVMEDVKTNPALDINDDDDEAGESLTREIIVIVLLSVINSCLLFITTLLIRRLQGLRSEYQSYDKTDEFYQVNTDDGDDSYLRRPKMISNNTYSDIDIYSASSGFISEDGSAKLQQELKSDLVFQEQNTVIHDKNEFDLVLSHCYETAESVRQMKKYQLKEALKDDKNDLTYERAMQSIDETMKMLQESAETL